jgi:hypothetical protein
MTITIEKQTKRNAAPSPSQFSISQSQYGWLAISCRRSHHSAASPNGSCASQTIPNASIPSSIPVPIGPAADSRVNAAPFRAKSASTASSATSEST